MTRFLRHSEDSNFEMSEGSIKNIHKDLSVVSLPQDDVNFQISIFDFQFI